MRFILLGYISDAVIFEQSNFRVNAKSY